MMLIRGHSLLLWKVLDSTVSQHFCFAGGVISRTVTQSPGISVICSWKPSLLPDHGETEFPSLSWCNSIHCGINFTKQPNTVSQNFEELCVGFVN